MPEKKEKLIFIMTHGSCDPELSTLPVVMANASLAMDVEAKIIMQGDAVMMAQKGYTQHVNAQGFAPLQELFDSYASQGGKLYVCTPCCDTRNIKKEDLVENAELVTSGFVIDECTSATNVLTY